MWLAAVSAIPFALAPRAVPRWTVAATVGAAAIAAYAAVIAYYVAGEDYFDAAEPTVTAVGWLFASGRPVYHGVDAAERYAHIYGPMLYVVHGWALRALEPGIVVSKAVGGVLAMAGIVCTWLAIARPDSSRARVIALTGACALVYLSFRNYTFWTRPEPLQLFCMSLGLLVAVRGRGHLAAVGLGLTAGLMWNLKFTGPVYSLPLFALWQRRAGWSATAVAAVTAAAGMVIPFIVFDAVSWTNYRTWVERSAVTGLLVPLLRQNVEWAIYLALPVIVLVSGRRTATAGPDVQTWAIVSGATAVAAGLVATAASKPGAGTYHLLPLVPVAAYLLASKLADGTGGAEPGRWRRSLVAGWCTSLCVIAATQQFQFIWTMTGRRADRTADDIRAFASDHAGTIEMGYGVSDPITFARPILVFRNGSYLLDQPAIGEHQLAGIPIPDATLTALQSCRVSYWLIPKGEEPFTARNFYPAVRFQPLYPEPFRQVFRTSYARVSETRYFDVWQCQR